MSNFSDSFNRLQQNVYGGRDVSESIRKSPIELRDTSPLSTLEGDPFKFSSISYPRDVTLDMQNGHYMLFYINVQNKTKYYMNPADSSIQGVGDYTTKLVERDDEEFGGFETEFTSYADTEASYRASERIKKGGKGSVIGSDGVDLRKGRKAMSGFSSVLPTTTRITDSIAIYLPPNVSETTTAGYNNAAEMGVIGLAAAGGVEFAQALARRDFAGAVRGLGGNVTDVIQEAVIKVGSTLASGLTGGGVDPEQIAGFANKAFGRATNPFMEVLFEKVGMRSFTYNFTFAPRNADETEDVQTIIKMFRFHMLPELKGPNSRYMTLPATFDIHYMYQMNQDQADENGFYSKIATCVLTDCAVDYTPGGVKSFASGAPTQITMALTFMETEMLTKQHIEKGY